MATTWWDQVLKSKSKKFHCFRQTVPQLQRFPIFLTKSQVEKPMISLFYIKISFPFPSIFSKPNFPKEATKPTPLASRSSGGSQQRSQSTSCESSAGGWREEITRKHQTNNANDLWIWVLILSNHIHIPVIVIVCNSDGILLHRQCSSFCRWLLALHSNTTNFEVGSSMPASALSLVASARQLTWVMNSVGIPILLQMPFFSYETHWTASLENNMHPKQGA